MQKYILIILLFLISCKGEVPQKHIDNRIIVFNMFVANGKITPFSIILSKLWSNPVKCKWWWCLTSFCIILPLSSRFSSILKCRV